MNGEHTPIEKAGADLRAAVSRMPELTLRVVDRWSPAFSFVGAALAVILVIGVPVLLSQTGSGGGSPLVGATTSTTTPTTVVVSSTTTERQEETTTIPTASECGTEPSFTTVLPDDFTGPIPGPSRDSPDPAEPGQLVWHWTGRDGSVEMRWPADAEYTESAEWGATSGMERDTDEVMFVALADLDLMPYTTLPTELMNGPCDAVQVSVLGPGGSLTGDSLVGSRPEGENTLILFPDLPRARDLEVIVESLSVENVPAVLECSGGSEAAGSEVPPIKTEILANRIPFPTPVEALEALLAGSDAETWPKTGYFELHESDGSITYGNPIDDLSADPRPENGLVISISVAQDEGGWSVHSWSTSGC